MRSQRFHKRRAPGKLPFWAVCALWVPASWISLIATPAWTQSQFEIPEPVASTVKSGACKVTTCIDYDFVDFRFRVYSSQKPNRLFDFPNGACSCERIVKPSGFNNMLLFARTGDDGRVRPNISVVRDRGVETTYEEFKRRENQLERLEAFSWRDDQFRKFDVFQTPVEGAHGARRLFFVPKDNAEVEFRGNSQKIAFGTALGRPLDDPTILEHGPMCRRQFDYLITAIFFNFSFQETHHRTIG